MKTDQLTSSQRRKLCIGFLFALTMLGVAAGTILVCVTDNTDRLSHPLISHNLIKNSGIKTVAEIFFDSFLPLGIILLVQFLLGFFAVGQPLEILSVIARGAAVGVSASVINLNYGLRGVAVNLVMTVPFALLSTIILVLGAREAVRFSNYFAKFAFADKNSDARPDIKLYCTRFAVLLIFSVLASTVDSLVICLFSGLLP